MTVRFEVSSFEQVQVTPGTALLRIVGRWQGPVRERLAPPMLVVDDGRRTHRLAALPGPDDANPLAGPDPPQWRAAFAAPVALLGGRSAFALDVGRGGLLDIPRPGVRASAVRPVEVVIPAPPADDERARRQAQERERAEQERQRQRAEEQERARARVQRERERLHSAEQARARAEREQQRLAAEERERERLRAALEQELEAQRRREHALESQRELRQTEREQALRAAQAQHEEELRQAQARRAAELQRAQAQRDAQLRRAQDEREAELRRAHAQLEADTARAQASRDAATRRIGELEQRIDGYRDMLAQATEALALANGRLEADAQELADALDAAATQSAQREQAQAEAQAARVELAELETEHARTLRRASAAQSDLRLEQDRVAKLQDGIAASEQQIAQLRAQPQRGADAIVDPGELAALQARVEHERAIAERLRAAYRQESAARDAEVVAWHAECRQALARAAQLADALAVARAELERLHDPAGLGAGSPAAPVRGLIRFVSDD